MNHIKKTLTIIPFLAMIACFTGACTAQAASANSRQIGHECALLNCACRPVPNTACFALCKFALCWCYMNPERPEFPKEIAALNTACCCDCRNFCCGWTPHCTCPGERYPGCACAYSPCFLHVWDGAQPGTQAAIAAPAPQQMVA